eukprot:1160814-Pelagomonas_calceolata.AAC.9
MMYETRSNNMYVVCRRRRWCVCVAGSRVFREFAMVGSDMNGCSNLIVLHRSVTIVRTHEQLPQFMARLEIDAARLLLKRTTCKRITCKGSAWTLLGCC